MKTPIFCGHDLLLADVPDDTRVIGPPPPGKEAGPAPSILAEALDQPLESPPLEDLVGSSSSVVIAFDDNALPLPTMRNELRPVAIKLILARLAKAGVEEQNVRLICAQGLHRKLTPAELAGLVGKDVYSRFAPDRVGNHDGEDPDGIMELGTTAEGRWWRSTGRPPSATS